MAKRSTELAERSHPEGQRSREILAAACRVIVRLGAERARLQDVPTRPASRRP